MCESSGISQLCEFTYRNGVHPAPPSGHQGNECGKLIAIKKNDDPETPFAGGPEQMVRSVLRRQSTFSVSSLCDPPREPWPFYHGLCFSNSPLQLKSCSCLFCVSQSRPLGHPLSSILISKSHLPKLNGNWAGGVEEADLFRS